MGQFNIVRLSESNFHMLHKLYGQVFGFDISYDNLFNKYTSPRFGPEGHFLGFLAINHAGEAVSFTGNVPYSISIDDTVYKAAQNGDTMTRPDARKNRLISILLNKCNDLCASLDYDFVYGFPNQNIHGIYVKHGGWSILEHALAVEVSVKSLPISSLVNKLSILESYFENYALEKFATNQIGNRIYKSEWNGVVRDDVFYDYKTYTTNHFLKFQHGNIWCKIKGALFIGDIELNNEFYFLDFVLEIKSFARSCGIRKIIFIASPEEVTMRHFVKHFPARQAHGIGYKILKENLLIDISKLRFTYGDYDTF